MGAPRFGGDPCGEARRETTTVRATAYLYPNPPLEGSTLTDIWGRDYPMRSEPFLEVLLCDLPPGKHEVEILSPASLKQTFEASSGHSTLFFAHHAFGDPKLSEVRLQVNNAADTEELFLPLRGHKLYGQVRDFDGRPFPAYVWAVSDDLSTPQAIVRTDKEGRFTLWYPEGKPLRAFVDDESYSRTTYECWIVSEGLNGDVRIDPRVGDFELWGLHAWRTELNWHVYFWPCSLPLDLRAKHLGREFSAPRLKKEEIVVRVEGEEMPLLSLHRVRVQVGTGKGRFHAAYLLDLPPLKKENPCRPTRIQVEVRTATRGRGEAWCVLWG